MICYMSASAMTLTHPIPLDHWSWVTRSWSILEEWPFENIVLFSALPEFTLPLDEDNTNPGEAGFWDCTILHNRLLMQTPSHIIVMVAAFTLGQLGWLFPRSSSCHKHWPGMASKAAFIVFWNWMEVSLASSNYVDVLLNLYCPMRSELRGRHMYVCIDPPHLYLCACLIQITNVRIWW